MQVVDFDSVTQSGIVVGGEGKNGGFTSYLLVSKISYQTLSEIWTKKYYTPANSGNTPKII